MNSLTFTIGKDPDTNNNLCGNLLPNLLILGDDSTDKNALINNIIQELTTKNTSEELKILLLDSLGYFSLFHNSSHLLKPVMTGSSLFPELFDFLIQEVDRRYELIKSEPYCNGSQKYNEKHPGEMPPIVVFIDEIANVFLKDPTKARLLFVRFFQKYQRASGIHFVINASTSNDNLKKWFTPIMQAVTSGNIIFFKPSRNSDYDIYGLNDKIKFPGNVEGNNFGYYISQNMLGRPKKFILQ